MFGVFCKLTFNFHECSVVIVWQLRDFLIGSAFNGTEHTRYVFRSNAPIRIDEKKLLKSSHLTEHKHPFLCRSSSAADAVSQLCYALVFSRILTSQLTKNFFGFVQIEEFRFFVFEQTQLRAL